MKRKAAAKPEPDASEFASPVSHHSQPPPSAQFPPSATRSPHHLHAPSPLPPAPRASTSRTSRMFACAEERTLLEAVNAHIAANGGLWNAVKTDPVLGARSSAGVKKHWESMCRRMFEGQGSGKHSDEGKAGSVEKMEEE